MFYDALHAYVCVGPSACHCARAGTCRIPVATHTRMYIHTCARSYSASKGIPVQYIPYSSIYSLLAILKLAVFSTALAILESYN